MVDRSWMSKGLCVTAKVDMFTVGAQQNITKRTCKGCPVILECLSEALDRQIEFGVWGGQTERERRAILRAHPAVSDWRGALERRRDAYEADAEPLRQEDAKRRAVALARAIATLPVSRPRTADGVALSHCPRCRQVIRVRGQTENLKTEKDADNNVIALWHYRCWYPHHLKVAEASDAPPPRRT